MSTAELAGGRRRRGRYVKPEEIIEASSGGGGSARAASKLSSRLNSKYVVLSSGRQIRGRGRYVKPEEIAEASSGGGGSARAVSKFSSGLNSKYVCLYMIDCESGYRDWYIVDILKHNNKGILNCRKISPAPKKFFTLPIFASSDSCLYFIGGAHQPGGPYQRGGAHQLEPWSLSDYVTVFDKDRPDLGFQEIPPMIKARSCGAVAACLDKKLYVFGANYDEDKPWAEYFDPTDKEWHSLDNPPSVPILILYAVAWEEDNSIFVGSIFNRKECGHALKYNISSRSWSVHKFPFDSCGDNGPAVVGSTFYWLNGYRLNAYDINSGKSYHGLVKCLTYGNEFGYDPSLIHLGNNEFYSCSVDSSGVNFDTHPAIFHCTRFTVSRIADGGGLKVLVLSRESTRLPRPWMHLLHALPLGLDGRNTQSKGSAPGERAETESSCASNAVAELGKLSIADS